MPFYLISSLTPSERLSFSRESNWRLESHTLLRVPISFRPFGAASTSTNEEKLASEWLACSLVSSPVFGLGRVDRRPSPLGSKTDTTSTRRRARPQVASRQHDTWRANKLVVKKCLCVDNANECELAERFNSVGVSRPDACHLKAQIGGRAASRGSSWPSRWLYSGCPSSNDETSSRDERSWLKIGLAR